MKLQIILIYFYIIVANVYILLHFLTISHSLSPAALQCQILEMLKADLLKDQLVHVNHFSVLTHTHTHTHTRSIKKNSGSNVLELYWLEYDEWTCQVWSHLRNNLAIFTAILYNRKEEKDKFLYDSLHLLQKENCSLSTICQWLLSEENIWKIRQITQACSAATLLFKHETQIHNSPSRCVNNVITQLVVVTSGASVIRRCREFWVP